MINATLVRPADFDRLHAVLRFRAHSVNCPGSIRECLRRFGWFLIDYGALLGLDVLDHVVLVGCKSGRPPTAMHSGFSPALDLRKRRVTWASSGAKFSMALCTTADASVSSPTNMASKTFLLMFSTAPFRTDLRRTCAGASATCRGFPGRCPCWRGLRATLPRPSARWRCCDHEAFARIAPSGRERNRVPIREFAEACSRFKMADEIITTTAPASARK